MKQSIIRRFLPALLCLLLLLVACGAPSAPAAATPEEPTWQEQYDLGLRLLSEGNYEEAIIAFTAAIEIDPKRAPAYVGRGDAHFLSAETEETTALAQTDYEAAIDLDDTCVEGYLGLSEVYIRQSLLEQALELLQRALERISDARLSEKLEALRGEAVQEIDTSPQTYHFYNADGSLMQYTIHYRDESGFIYRTESYTAENNLSVYFLLNKSADGIHFYYEGFNLDGTSIQKGVQVLDGNGKWLYTAVLDENGNEISQSVSVYDDNGNCIGANFSGGGAAMRYEDGKTIMYNPDGSVLWYIDDIVPMF